MQPLIYCNLVIPYMLETDENYQFVLQSIIIAAIVLLLRVWMNTPQYLWGTIRVGEAIGYNPNTIGLVLSLASILSYSLFFIYKKKQYLPVMILLGFASLFSGSRKAFAILILGIILFSLTSKRRKKQFFLSFCFTIVFLFLLVYMTLNWDPLYLVVGKRIESLVQGLIGKSTDLSTSTRFDMILYGIQLFMQKPFLGHGLGSYRFLSGFYTYSHNNYTELLVSFGLFGTVFYYSIHLRIFIQGMKLLLKNAFRNNFATMACVFVIIIMIMDFGFVSYFSEYMQLVLAVSYVSLQKARTL